MPSWVRTLSVRLRMESIRQRGKRCFRKWCSKIQWTCADDAEQELARVERQLSQDQL